MYLHKNTYNHKDMFKTKFFSFCLSFVLMVSLCFSCTNESPTSKKQGKRDHVLNLHDQIKEITIDEEDVLIGNIARIYLLNQYLIIADHKSTDKLIHIFD